jgi:hypothetical protein
MIFTRRDIELGEKARSVVENETYKDAFVTVRNRYIESLINTAEDDTARREKAYMAVRMLDEVESHLISMMDKGKLAKQHLDKLNRR